MQKCKKFVIFVYISKFIRVMAKYSNDKDLFREGIITAGRYSYSRALILQSLLKGEGIECFLVTHEPELQAFQSSVELKVRKGDIAKTMRLVAASAEGSGKRKEKALESIRTVRRILVPVDFSNQSVNAGRFAATLANKFKAEVTLLHVYYNPAIDVTPYDDHYAYQVKLASFLHEIEVTARENMAQLQDNLKKWAVKKGFKTLRLVPAFLNGPATAEILAFAENYNPAVIIMGTRGLSKEEEKGYGRTASSIINMAKFPVLALPEGPVKEITDVKRIMYATDLDDSDFSFINRLIAMVAPFGCRLHCVHVSLGMKKPWEKVRLEQLHDYLTGQYAGQHITFSHLVGDSLMNSLETYVRDHKIDLITVVSHKRRFPTKLFTESVTRRIFSEIKKPLLVFHTK